MSHHHPADWKCRCGHTVFGSKSQCFKCGFRRSSPPPSNTSAVPAQMLPGDWTCPSCASMVFASKSHCFKCSTPRPAPAVPQSQPTATPAAVAPAAAVPLAATQAFGRRPDWPCPSCGMMIFGSKDRCFKCGTTNPAAAGAPPAPASPAVVATSAPPAPAAVGMPGDWSCPTCSFVVFASKPACFKCGTPRPPNAVPATTVTAPVAKTKFADWNCAGCGSLVFGSRAGCFKCGRPNPGLSAASTAAPAPAAATSNDPDELRRLREELAKREQELEQKAESAKSNLRLALAPPPPYWDLSVSGATVFPAPGSHRVLLDVPEIEAIQALVLSTLAGRDPQQNAPTIVRAWRIQNDNLWLKYCMNRDLMVDAAAATETKQPELFTLIDAQERTSQRTVAQKRFLLPACNEQYLWHATGAAAVSIICEEGFDERVCALSGLFGAGVYFAELASKSFGYMPSGPCVDAAHNQSVGYMFLARVSLGQYHAAPEGTTMSNIRRPPGGADSVVGVPSRGAPREFIVYDRRQTYPEFLLEVKR